MMRTAVAQVDFGHLRIAYDERVLAPRPWTAAQSAWAAELMVDAPAGPVLEVCCGAGQIGLLAVSRVPRPLVAVDLSPAACELTRFNAEAAGLGRRVDVRQGPMDTVLGPAERFGVIIADPPWIRRDEAGRGPQSTDLGANGGHDGMDVAWACTTVADRHLVPGGTEILQLGTPAQAEAVRAHLEYSDLEMGEIRGFDQGVLVRIDRPLTVQSS